MAKPHCAVVSRFRGDHVARADVLLHLAGRPVRKARKESGGERDSFGGVDGAQRRFLLRRETRVAGRSAAAGPLVSLGSIDDVAWGLMHVFSGRAAYIHVGAIFGTIMTANVWFSILPAQRKMVAAAAAGEKFDPSLGAQAKLRSKHNTFMAVPAVFLMLSNHFP